MPPKTPRKSVSEEASAPTTPAAALSTELDVGNMKVAELKEALIAKGLSPKGLKKELVERLEEAMKTPASKLKEEVRDVAESEKEETTQVEEKASSMEIVKQEEQVDYSLETKDEEVTAAEPTEQTPKEAPVTIVESSTNEIEESSDVVHITGFVRPFTLQSAKELVEQFGTVVTFWMDSIKTHGYIKYEKAESAAACLAQLNGMQWPVEVGKILSATFASPAEMEEAVQMDGNADNRKRRLEDPSEPSSKRTRGLDELFLKTETKPHLYYLPAKPL